MAFCDWFSGFINLDVEHFHNGKIVYIRPTGEIDFEISKPLEVFGSYDDKVMVSSRVVPSSPEWSLLKMEEANFRVYISGNPTKFLQGHNVYGHQNMTGIIRDFIKLVLQKIDIDEFTIARVLRDPIRITRIDITQSYQLDCASDVSSWLRHAGQYMTGKNQRVDADKTLYVGKNSRRVAIKIYEKSAEMLKHKKTFNLTETAFNALYEVALKLLRFEVTLRGMKLEDLNMNYLQKVDNKMIEDQFSIQLQKMNLPENLELVESEINDLPSRYVGVYSMWLAGVDLKQKMSLATYKRYRKYFLENYNLDLSMLPVNIPHKTNVIPLWRYIVAGDREFHPSADDEYLYVPISKNGYP